MGFSAEWTNADALAFKPYTAYKSVSVTYSATTDPVDDLRRENAELRKLVRRMFYAVNPSDREQLLVNVAELGIEVGE